MLSYRRSFFFFGQPDSYIDLRLSRLSLPNIVVLSCPNVVLASVYR